MQEILPLLCLAVQGQVRAMGGIVIKVRSTETVKRRSASLEELTNIYKFGCTLFGQERDSDI